jgi:hypothetical protein
LAEKILREVLYSFELFLWILATALEDISHATRIITNSLGNTIDSTELWRNVAIFAVDLDDKERLLSVCDLKIIGLQEIFGNAHLLSIMSFKSHCHRILLEVDISHNISALLAISANDSLVMEFIFDASLNSISVSKLTLDLMNPL